MDLSNPLSVITPTLDGRVLAVLAATTAPATAAEIYRRVGGASDEGVRKVLARLTAQGIVRLTAIGRTRVYALNREHLAAPCIEAVTHLRAALLNRIRDELLTWRIQPVQASLFGSFARGDAGAHSDIDLLIVRPLDADEDSWYQQLSDLEERIEAWTGNAAQIVETDVQTLRDMDRQCDPLLESWRADGVHLCGDPLAQVLRGAA